VTPDTRIATAQQLPGDALTKPASAKAEQQSGQDEVADIVAYRAQSRQMAVLRNTDPLRACEEFQNLAPRSLNGMLLLDWAYQQGLDTAVDPVQAAT